MPGDKNPFEPFLGTWRTSGQTRATADSSSVPITGTDSYEQLIGNEVILHRVDVYVGKEHVETIEILGQSHDTGEYFMHSFDANGDAGVMQATYENDVWKCWGQTSRFTGGFSDNGNSFSGLWERTEDGRHWTPWMDIKLKRVK